MYFWKKEKISIAKIFTISGRESSPSEAYAIWNRSEHILADEANSREVDAY